MVKITWLFYQYYTISIALSSHIPTADLGNELPVIIVIESDLTSMNTGWPLTCNAEKQI